MNWPVRRPALPALLGALPLVLLLGAGAPPPEASRAADAVAKVVPAVVNISVWRDLPTTPSDSQRLAAPATRERSFGSGFVIDPTGIIVTNKHVVDGADTITVSFEGERRYRARVLASAVSIDLALLKIEADHELPVVQFDDSDTLRVGESVLAIGNPLSVGISVTSGVVSALNRDIHDTPFDDYIQTDASTNPGSSGGPLIDLDGRVIGVNTAYLTGNGGKNVGSIGIAFALPALGTQFVIERLLRYGSVRAGWLGFQVQEVTPEMDKALGLPHPAPEGGGQRPPGLIVTSVEPGLAAAQAGIQVGDVVYAYNDEMEADPRALMRAVGRTEIGKTATLELWRAGAMMKQEVVVGEWPAEHAAPRAPHPPMVKDPALGLEVQVLLQTTDGSKPKVDGVVVTGVVHESVAMYGGVEVGDVIAKVFLHDVSEPAELFAAFAEARKQGREFVSLLIRRRGVAHWTTLPL